MKWNVPNPILLRELRSTMRGRRIMFVITGYVALLAMLAGITYFSIYNYHISRSSYGYGSNPTVPMAEFGPDFGRSLMSFTVLLLLILLSFITPAFGAVAVAGEKDRQTYDTLLITTMTARQIVWGKLGPILILLLLFVALSLPIQSMAFFFGGVALPDLLIASFGIIVSILLFSTLSFYISAWTETTMRAIVLSYTILISCMYIIPVVGLLIWEIIDSRLYRNPLNEVLELILAYSGYIFLSCNPFGAAIMSGVAIFEGEGYFFYDVNEVMSFSINHEVWIPAPWIIYSLFSLVLSRILISMAIRQVEEISEI